MSLQDDYFELDSALKGWKKAALNRIWEAFCDMEKEYDELVAVRNHLREAVRLAFKEPESENNESNDDNPSNP